MPSKHEPSSLDVLIVGAGFSGMYMLQKMRQHGFSARTVDAGPDVGGTWCHNRYPGLRCDVESLEYCYTFSEELRSQWNWSERYPPQSEIHAYARFVTDKLDLRRDIQLNTRIASAEWNEDTALWTVTAENGQLWTARWLVMATGCLSVPRFPNIPGADLFEGALVHTAAWPHGGVKIDGKTVGLIGTGSSGVQVATALAGRAKHLSVFQRTPAYTIPARNRPLTDEDRKYFRDNFAELDAWARTTSGGIMTGPAKVSALEVSPEEREAMLWKSWNEGGSFRFTGTFNDVRKNADSNFLVAEFVRRRIHEIVKDPGKAELLCPHDYIAARRVCVDTGYYEIFNRNDVSLIDVASDPIETITKDGLRLKSGADHKMDVLILATGYDAMTGALRAIDIRGKERLTLKEAWASGPRTYLGLAVAGFPNLFTVTGPGSPSVLSNMLRSIEHHVEWITDCLVAMREKDKLRIEADGNAQDKWVAHVSETAEKTVFSKTASWYMGADIPGKPRVFMPYAGGMPIYVETCREIAERGYEGFKLA
jgi:cyclohexanone monooxygenase